MRTLFTSTSSAILLGFALGLGLLIVSSPAHAREAPVAETQPPPPVTFEQLPGGVLHQIQQKLLLREQYQFKRLSKTIHDQLSRVRHLTAEKLRPEEQHFHSFSQYYNASRSGRFYIDAVQLEFRHSRECAAFLNHPVARRQIIKLSLGKTCSETLLRELNTPGETYESFLLGWGPGLEGLSLDLSQVQLDPSEKLATLFNGLNFSGLKALKLRLPTPEQQIEFETLSASRLAEALSRLPALERFTLVGGFSPTLFQHLQLSLKSLSLDDVGTSAAELNDLVAPFIARTAATLETLHIGPHQALKRSIGRPGTHIDSLVTAVSQARHLRALSLPLLFAYQPTPAWDTLFQFQALKSLSFQTYKLNDERSVFLSELLRRHWGLETLVLRKMQLSAQRIEELSAALGQLTQLRKLDLAHNMIGGNGLHTLLHALSREAHLESLDLSHSFIVNHYAEMVPLFTAPPVGVDFSIFKDKFRYLKALNLNGNVLAEEPGILRRFVGLAYSPTPTVLSAFKNSPLESLQVNLPRVKNTGFHYALNFHGDLSAVTQMDFWGSDLQDLLDTPFYRSYSIDPRKVRKLGAFGLPDRVLKDPSSFQQQFASLETLEVWSKPNELRALIRALPPGIRFLKVQLPESIKELEWKGIQSALAAKDIRLYHLQVLNDDIDEDVHNDILG